MPLPLLSSYTYPEMVEKYCSSWVKKLKYPVKYSVKRANRVIAASPTVYKT
jgi:hypothetical protein